MADEVQALSQPNATTDIEVVRAAVRAEMERVIAPLRQQQAELPLDSGALVLPRAPDVREEEVPACAPRSAENDRSAGPKRGGLGPPEAC